ncbi:MAG: hypothetical protein ACK559_40990, partial [bacterium]
MSPNLDIDKRSCIENWIKICLETVDLSYILRYNFTVNIPEGVHFTHQQKMQYYEISAYVE